MHKNLLSIALVVGLVLCCLCSPADAADRTATGTIQGTVVVPGKVDLKNVPDVAKIFIYLRDETRKDKTKTSPWGGPIVKVIERQINSLSVREVKFEFKDVAPGTYCVSVLIDVGRPHVRPGTAKLMAYPGDHIGRTEADIKVRAGDVVKVKIDCGMYITIPKGYKSPLYLPE